jgi:HSP20 family protein
MENTMPKTEARPSQPTTQQVPVREKAPASEAGSYAGRWFEPAVDIYETEDALTLVADLPGIAPEHVSTDLRENLLTITARSTNRPTQWKPVYEEFAEGHYTRQFRLGQQIDQAKISAVMKDGVLTLTLPKADAARPRKIQVKAE